MFAHHHIQREPLSVRERMTAVLVRLQGERYVEFSHLFDPTEGRMGVTVTFLALLELLKESLINVVQSEAYGPIHVAPAEAESDSSDTQPESL